MKKAFKVRIYPNQKQQKQIDQTIGNCRFFWNYCLDKVIKFKKENGNYKNFKQPNPKDLKKELPWLKLGSSRGLQQVQRDLVEAFKNIKRNGNLFPKFKKKKNKNSYREPQVKNQVRIQNNKIHLMKLGFIKFKCSKRYSEILNNIDYKNIKNATISKSTIGRYYASICCEVNIPKKEKVNKEIGIDLGLKSFISTSDNKQIETPKFFRKSQEKLAFQQRKLSKKELYSNNWYKQNKKIGVIHEKIKNQRSYFLHNLSPQIINENQVICLEDLKVENMIKNHKLSKSIADASWSEFVRQLNYKSEWYGRIVVQVGTYFPSSKTCYKCGWKNSELKLSDRTFICQECGAITDRDYNASLNILKEGKNLLKNSTDELSGSNASGVEAIASTINEELQVVNL